MHPIFCSIQDAPCIQVYNIESAPLICLNIQGASSIEHTIYGHVLGHKGGGGARAPSAPWLDPPLVMLLVHKDISHMPITELENDSESIWVKVFANKTSHFVASWYRPPGSTSEEFKLFREQLDYIKTHHKGKKLPSAHVLGDFNFKDIDWPDRLSKSGSTLSQSEGQIWGRNKTRDQRPEPGTKIRDQILSAEYGY